MTTLRDKIQDDVYSFIEEHEDVSMFDSDKEELVDEIMETISDHILPVLK